MYRNGNVKGRGQECPRHTTAWRTVSADIAAMWKVIETDGLYWTNKKTGEPKEHPAAKRMDALRRDYLKALTMLGLRASVAEPEQVQHETLEEILHG